MNHLSRWGPCHVFWLEDLCGLSGDITLSRCPHPSPPDSASPPLQQPAVREHVLLGSDTQTSPSSFPGYCSPHRRQPAAQATEHTMGSQRCPFSLVTRNTWGFGARAMHHLLLCVSGRARVDSLTSGLRIGEMGAAWRARKWGPPRCPSWGLLPARGALGLRVSVSVGELVASVAIFPTGLWGPRSH